MSIGRKIILGVCSIVLFFLLITLMVVFVPDGNKKEEIKKEIIADTVIEYVQKKYDANVEEEIVTAKEILSGDRFALICKMHEGVSKIPEYVSPSDVMVDKYENIILIYEEHSKYSEDKEDLSNDENIIYVEEINLEDTEISDNEIKEDEKITSISYVPEIMQTQTITNEIKESGTTKKIKVGILDTGLYNENSEVVKYININESYDYVNKDNNVFDKKDNHATMVTSSFLEVVGSDIAENNVEIVVGKVLENGSGSYYNLYLAIMEMSEECDIINLSLGGSREDRLVEEALKYAKNNSCVVICAAGNDGESVSYPAKSDYTIAVSAIDDEKKLASFSNYGEEIDFTAPGVDINCHSINYSKKIVDGTSFSAPIITGVATLLWLQDQQNMDIEKMKSKITELCEDLGENGKDQLYGNGMPVFKGGVLEEDIEQNNNSITPEKANEVWTNYINSKSYTSIITDSMHNGLLEYCISDINADGIPELIIQSVLERPFFYTWVFALSGENVELVDERYGYGMYRYSSKYNAILVSSDTKPSAGASSQEFCILEGTKLKTLFILYDDLGNLYCKDENGNMKDITQEELSSYYENTNYFQFTKIN